MKQIESRVRKGYPTVEEFKTWVDEAAALVEKYKWFERTVSPWGTSEHVSDVIAYVEELSHCGNCERHTSYLLAKGLTPILNEWERVELYGVTLKNLKTGKTFKIDPEWADDFLELNNYILIERSF